MGVFSYVSTVFSSASPLFFSSNTLVLSISIFTSLLFVWGATLLFELLFLTYLLYFKEVRRWLLLLASGELKAILKGLTASLMQLLSLVGVVLVKPSYSFENRFLGSIFSDVSSVNLSSVFYTGEVKVKAENDFDNSLKFIFNSCILRSEMDLSQSIYSDCFVSSYSSLND